jgi:hypothetical protein
VLLRDATSLKEKRKLHFAKFRVYAVKRVRLT